MADQLTSVRFNEDTIEALRVLADLNDTNVAAEIRTAVLRYIEAEISASDFDSRLEAAHRERQQAVQRMLAMTSR